MIALHVQAIRLDHKLIEVTHLYTEILIKLITNGPYETVLIQDVLTNSLTKPKKNFVIDIHEQTLFLIDERFLQRYQNLRTVTYALLELAVYPALLKPVPMLYLKVAKRLF